MGRYTFEQIVNEKIREMDEIDRMTNEFNELVESPGDKYNFVTARTLVCDKDIGLYCNYTKEIKNFTYKFHDALLSGDLLRMKLYQPPVHVFFKDPSIARCKDKDVDDINDMKSEYKDDKGNTILTIKDVEKFKEMYYAFYESDVVKEYYNCIEGETIANNGSKIYFDLHMGFWKFWNKYSELALCGNEWIVMQGGKYNARKILDMFKSCEFDGSLLTDYFKENMETNTSKDCSLVFADKFISKPYKPNFMRGSEEGFEIHKDEAAKKITLIKTRQY